MEFKGTKGKWEVYKPDHIGCVNVSVGKYDGFNGFVELWHHHFENKQEAEANAKLIASAPEMFEMLQRVVLMTETCEGNFSDFRERYNFNIKELLTKITE